MKRHILPLLLAVCLLLSMTSISALAVPDVTGNVGDDNGVVTGDGTTATTVTTAPATTPATTAPTTLPTTTAPTTAPTTTAPTTTGTDDMAEEGNVGRVIGIILAILIAAAIVVLVVILLPRMRDKRNGR